MHRPHVVVQIQPRPGQAQQYFQIIEKAQLQAVAMAAVAAIDVARNVVQ